MNLTSYANGYVSMTRRARYTFGVVNRCNGIAGSYAERVPVIAITGAPTQAAERR